LELSFTVNGTEDTAGYVKVTIAKSLVANAADIKVYMDGNQLNYDVTSNADLWLLSFTYTHSAHKVMISLATKNAEDTFLSNDLILIAVVIVIVVAGVVSFMIWRKKKKT
jgi:heme/copper-type cytochrome/quinol oxidase subunit 2